jgi:hypothetical protein
MRLLNSVINPNLVLTYTYTHARARQNMLANTEIYEER